MSIQHIKTENNIHNLANDIVDAWDMDAVIEYAIDGIKSWLAQLTKEEFEYESRLFYGEEKEG